MHLHRAPLWCAGLVHAPASWSLLRIATRCHIRDVVQQQCLCRVMAARAPRPPSGPPRPPRHPPPAWIAATAERHRVAREAPPAAAATPARWTAAASAYTHEAEVLSRIPGTENMSPAAQAVASELAKIRRNSGVSPAAFEPPRLTMIIEGRPVQVPAAGCSTMRKRYTFCFAHVSFFNARRRGKSGRRRTCRRGCGQLRGKKQLSLARFSERGPPDWIGPAWMFGPERNIWRTRRPPDGADAWVEPWSTILIARGCLALGGDWLGPRNGSGRAERGKPVGTARALHVPSLSPAKVRGSDGGTTATPACCGRSRRRAWGCPGMRNKSVCARARSSQSGRAFSGEAACRSECGASPTRRVEFAAFAKA